MRSTVIAGDEERLSLDQVHLDAPYELNFGIQIAIGGSTAEPFGISSGTRNNRFGCSEMVMSIDQE